MCVCVGTNGTAVAEAAFVLSAEARDSEFCGKVAKQVRRCGAEVRGYTSSSRSQSRVKLLHHKGGVKKAKACSGWAVVVSNTRGLQFKPSIRSFYFLSTLLKLHC